MPDLYAVAGSKIYIGGVLASKATNFIVSDFGSQSWVEIDGWETAGPIGDSAEVISTNLINRSRVIKQKGTDNAGSNECQFAIVAADPGQTALIAAAKTKNSYAFRIVWSSGETQYFIALVMSRNRVGGNANSVQMISTNLEINSNVVDA